MSLYTDLRVKGEVIVPADEAGQISALRRHARADGLAVVASRGSRRDLKNLSRAQARQRPYIVALVDPSDPTTIVRPDAQEA